MRQTLLRGLALLLGGILLGMLLLMAAYALPTEPIRKHLGESLLCFDGSDGMPETDNETLVKTYSSTWLDIRTDLVMMLIAAYDSDASPWEQALENRMYNDTERYYRLSERLAALAKMRNRPIPTAVTGTDIWCCSSRCCCFAATWTFGC